MGLVTVVAAKDFVMGERVVYAGDAVEVEAIDAAVLSQRGDVDLNARPTYRTRDLQAAPVKSGEPQPGPLQPAVKRRRGRPRKIKA